MAIKTDLFSLKKDAWNCDVSIIRIEIKGVSAAGFSTPGDGRSWSLSCLFQQRWGSHYGTKTFPVLQVKIPGDQHFFVLKKYMYQQLQKHKRSKIYVKCNLIKMGFVTLKKGSLVVFFFSFFHWCCYFFWPELTRKLWTSGILTWTCDSKRMQIKEKQKWKFVWSVLILIKQQKSTDSGWTCFYLQYCNMQ